jgi:hypothetical protein
LFFRIKRQATSHLRKKESCAYDLFQGIDELGIGEALRDEYALVEGQLPNRLAVLLKQLEEGSLEEALTRHPSMRAA